MLKRKNNSSVLGSPIFIKYVITFFVILLITVSVIVGFFMYYRAEKMHDIISEIDYTSNNTAEIIGNKIEVYKNLTIYPLLRTSEGFVSKYLNCLKSESNAANNQYEYYKSFSALASSIYSLNKSIYAQYSYNMKGDSIVWKSISANNLSFPDISIWQDEANSAHGAAILIEPFHIDNQKYKEDLFGVVRAIVEVPSNEILGYFAMTVKLEEIINPCNQMQLYSDQNTYLINSQNQVIMSLKNGSRSPALDKFLKENAGKKDIFENTYGAVVDKELSYVYVVDKIPNTQWAIFTSIPLKSLWHKQNRFMFLSLFLTILLLVILFSVVFIVFFTSVTRPINKLISLVSNSGFIPELEESPDEIKFLTSSFTKFSDTIQNIQAEHFIQQKKLRLEFLQLQINPHFLYGTLESIRMIAEYKNDLDISNMVAQLSQILRYSIGTENIIATLQQELKILNNYIYIQKMRHDYEISVIFDIAPECYSVFLPKLSLQPIVENVLIHGVSDNEPIEITVGGKCIGESTELCVSDNGCGMSEEKLNELRLSFAAEKGSSSHIGLFNVNQRIKLMYGESYGISVESTLGKGTTVKIKLPRNGNEK